MPRRPRRRARAFTLTDLCIVLAILALLLGGLLPAVRQDMNGQSARQRCFGNLRLIGQGIQMYANENKGNFPKAIFEVSAPRYAAYTNPMAPSPFAPNSVSANDVTAALFLIPRTQDVASSAFICPEAPVGEPWDFGGKQAGNVSNFPGRQYLTYSYANPYPSQQAMNSGFKSITP